MSVLNNEHRNKQNKKLSPQSFKAFLEGDTNLKVYSVVFLNAGVVVYAEVDRTTFLEEVGKLDLYDIVEYQDYKDGVLVGVTGL